MYSRGLRDMIRSSADHGFGACGAIGHAPLRAGDDQLLCPDNDLLCPCSDCACHDIFGVGCSDHLLLCFGESVSNLFGPGVNE